MTDLATLIEELSSVEEGSRELDLAIFLYLHPGWEKRPYMPRARKKVWFDAEGKSTAESVSSYTTSLDAKLPWENISGVACYECVPGEPLGEVWEAWHENMKTDQRTMGAGNTEVLARRIAALRARAQEEDR